MSETAGKLQTLDAVPEILATNKGQYTQKIRHMDKIGRAHV